VIFGSAGHNTPRLLLLLLLLMMLTIEKNN
jgi:hypothetical protein